MPISEHDVSDNPGAIEVESESCVNAGSENDENSRLTENAEDAHNHGQEISDDSRNLVCSDT